VEAGESAKIGMLLSNISQLGRDFRKQNIELHFQNYLVRMREGNAFLGILG
jgi:hypothetical protein